jgi:formylglycine-generating enzyme required for sulfatase activity
MTCNGEEFDSGAASGDQDAVYPTASSTFPMCYTDWGAAGVVYDLSGNVKEWTATATATGIHEIRGGSYNNVERGRTCQFDFTVGDSNFAFPNTGFRCCFY